MKKVSSKAIKKGGSASSKDTTQKSYACKSSRAPMQISLRYAGRTYEKTITKSQIREAFSSSIGM